MTEPASAQDLFKGRHFDQEIIILCVRWYLAFKLSSRDLVQMMAERGVLLAHTTILRWVRRYVCLILKSVGRRTPDRWVTRGAWMRLTSRSKASGSTSIAPWIKRAAPSIFS